MREVKLTDRQWDLVCCAVRADLDYEFAQDDQTRALEVAKTLEDLRKQLEVE
jgi:hypothetical protein